MSTSETLEIRPALPAEAATYARVAAETFEVAYRETSDPANLAAHVAREFGEARQRAELEDPARTVLAAREPGGDWAGFAALRAGSRAEGVTGARPIEIVRFYTQPRWHGRGAAARLMAAALAWGADRGHDEAWLQVWEHNARARRFYEKCGFRAVGTNPFLFGDEWEADIVYRRALDPDIGR